MDFNDFALALFILGLLIAQVIAFYLTLLLLRHFTNRAELRYVQGITSFSLAVIGLQLAFMLWNLPASFNFYENLYNNGELVYWKDVISVLVYLFLALALPFAIFYYTSETDPRICHISPSFKAMLSALCTFGVLSIIGVLIYLPKGMHVVEFDPRMRVVNMVTLKPMSFLSFYCSLPGLLFNLLFFPFSLASELMDSLAVLSFRPSSLKKIQQVEIRQQLHQRATLVEELADALESKYEAIAALSGFSRVRKQSALNKKVVTLNQAVELLEEDFELFNGTASTVRRKFLIFWSVCRIIALVTLTVLYTLQIFATFLNIERIVVTQQLLQLPGLKELVIYPFLVVFTVTCIIVCFVVRGISRICNFALIRYFIEPLKRKNVMPHILVFYSAVVLSISISMLIVSPLIYGNQLRGSDIYTRLGSHYKDLAFYSALFPGKACYGISFSILVLVLIFRSVFFKHNKPRILNDYISRKRWNQLLDALGAKKTAPGYVSKPSKKEESEQSSSLTGILSSKCSKVESTIQKLPQKLASVVNPVSLT